MQPSAFSLVPCGSENSRSRPRYAAAAAVIATTTVVEVVVIVAAFRATTVRKYLFVYPSSSQAVAQALVCMYVCVLP